MTLSAGARLGPYEIQSLIGAGGMGEVYRARDRRLERTVAIKLLPEDVADRVDRRTRFEAEARTISSLSHPHICTLFDVGDEGGRPFLVMEFLEGETLDDRLSRSALPAEEVLRYAVQIADALSHAHRAHIIHRDLKPSNVMLLPSGVKLLDFGLARRYEVDAAPVGASTVSIERRKLTSEGAILGTFQYMAPEQLEGREADERTDIFAFGTLVYEMATGRKAFAGKSQASLIASILTEHPPVISAARPDSGLPAALDHVVERCLAKNPDDRWQTARDVRLELEWIAGHGAKPFPTLSVLKRQREAIAWTVTVLALVAAAGMAMWLQIRELPVGDLTRFVITPPPGTVISASENTTRMALSPDGKQLAFVGTTDGEQQLWVRPLASLDARPLPGTEGALSPFWSPDSRYIGFFTPVSGELKKVDVTGGPPRAICTAQMDGAATWGPDGTILFTQFLDGLYRVSSDGGTPIRVTTPNKAGRELNHYWPSFLPDGRHFIYLATALDTNGFRATPSVYVASLDSAERTLVGQLHSRMVYAPPGYLLFVEQGTLLARPFDPVRLKVTGEPVKVAEGIHYYRTLGQAVFSISTTGVLAYQDAVDDSRLVWFDRRGNVTDPGWPKQTYGLLRLSPDARSLAADIFDRQTGTSDIWIYSMSQGAPIRFTLDPDDESDPVWSPDGRRIMFRTNRGGPASLKLGSAAPNLFAKTLGINGDEELIVANPGPLNPEDWSADGRWITYIINTRQTARDLWMIPTEGERKPRAFAATRFDEWGARFSPNSQRVAFVSAESGAPEVYVAAVRESGEKIRVSTGGGTSPRWRRDGRALFYASADYQSVMTVPIEWNPDFRAGTPTRLFSIGSNRAVRFTARGMMYDVTPDGERFVVNLSVGDPGASRITIVQNWVTALKP